MGFDGVHRASVGLQVPGAGILLLLSWERVNSGAATSTITKLRLSFIIDTVGHALHQSEVFGVEVSSRQLPSCRTLVPTTCMGGSYHLS